jgi:hypothetical protein
MRRRKWSKQAVIDKIRALYRARESLSTRNMAQLGYSGMVTSCYSPELFGGWWSAIRAAGLDPKKACTRRKKWTSERIILEIRRLQRQGVDLSHSAAKRRHQYLVVAARRTEHLGSWRAAVQAAGFDYGAVSKHESWTKDKIVARIRELQRRGGALSHQEAKQSQPSLVSAASSPRFFGSWARAVDAAGLDYDSVRKTRRWTKDRIVQTIRKLYQEGRPLNNSSMRRIGYRGMMAAARRPAFFGSWEAAIRAAGLDYDQIRKS